MDIIGNIVYSTYATSIRKVNKPEQTVSVIGNNGLVCLYDIQLDN